VGECDPRKGEIRACIDSQAASQSWEWRDGGESGRGIFSGTPLNDSERYGRRKRNRFLFDRVDLAHGRAVLRRR